MFGFKKILKELVELRKEVNELKKYSKPTLVKEPQNKDNEAQRTRKKLKGVGRGKIDYSKVEPEKRYPTDISVEALAKKMKISTNTLNNRIVYLRNNGVRWANDKRHVYFVDIPGRLKPQKHLSLYAQDKLFRKYGYGKKK